MVRGGLRIALLGLIATASLPARAQSRPDYRAASPRGLVQALKTAPPGQRNAIAEAMLARRNQVLPEMRG